MKRSLRPVIRALGTPLAALGLAVLRLSGRRVGLALLYHSTGEPRHEPELDIVPPHSPGLFAGQMRHLRRWYRVVDSTELLVAVSSRRRGARFPVAITFDDDLPEHVRVALPILEREGLRATFFLCGASLDGPFAFWWERLQRAFDRDAGAAAAAVADGSREPPGTAPTVRKLAESIEQLSPVDREGVAARLGFPLARRPSCCWCAPKSLRARQDNASGGRGWRAEASEALLRAS